MKNKYSFQEFDVKNMVRVRGKSLPISMKTTSEVLKYIRGKEVNKAIRLLEEVKDAKRAVPFLKYKKDIPHRKGNMSVGRYPKKVSENMILLLNLLKSNAKDKGLDEDSLSIIHSAAHAGPNLMHYGRQRRRLRKICHVELIAQEKKEVSKK
jgi:large subunit ribosomal protein L22